jgi:hypothetical protein
LDVEKLHAKWQNVRVTSEEKPGESGNVEVQWNNIKEYVLDAVSDLLGDSKGEQESHGLCRKD